jgi:hypothetical protein
VERRRIALAEPSANLLLTDIDVLQVARPPLIWPWAELLREDRVDSFTCAT